MKTFITPKPFQLRDLLLFATIANSLFLQTILAETWSIVSSGTTNDIEGVTWDGSRFAAVDSGGGVLQSTNGRVWTRKETGPYFRSIIAGGGHWLALTDYSSTYWDSSDLATWKEHYAGTDSWLLGGLFHNGTFFLVGENGLITKSTNGINWSPITTGVTDSDLNSLIYGGGLFVAAGDDGIFTSNDSIHWKFSTSDLFSGFVDIAYNEGRFVAITFPFSRIYSSADGRSWTYIQTKAFDDTLVSVAGGSAGFKIVCEDGRAFSTSDGKTYQAINMATTSNFNDVAYGNGIYVAVGDSGLIRIFDSANAKPEIVVQQPKGSGLTDGSAKRTFGTVKIGKKSATKTFTIKNTGNAKLSGLTIKKFGNSPKDFIVSQPTKSSLAPGSTTTFTVAFRPAAKGAKSSMLSITSNDPNENPFDIRLAGVGVK